MERPTHNEFGEEYLHLPQKMIDDMNRQMEDIENQPTRPAREVLDEARRLLQDYIDAQGLDESQGERAVA